jgi:hypothetical protein
MAREDLLTTQVTAHEDLLTAFHAKTDDLLDNTDKQWKNNIIIGRYGTLQV